jgi:hypothetical protein
LPTTDELLRHPERQVELPWRDDLAPEYRVWILHHDQALERRIRNHVPEFEAITRRHGKGWFTVDLAGPAVPGRLLVFFPGRYEGNSYRLLDARDGWSYRATQIPA